MCQAPFLENFQVQESMKQNKKKEKKQNNKQTKENSLYLLLGNRKGENILFDGVGWGFLILKRGFGEGLTEIWPRSKDPNRAMYIGISDASWGNGNCRDLKVGGRLLFKKGQRGQCIWDRVNKGEELGDNYCCFRNRWRDSHSSSLPWVYVILLLVQKWKAFSELEILTLE